MQRTIIISVIFFALVGPAVPIVEMFFIKLALKGLIEPEVILIYPIAMLFGGGFIAASVGLGYGVLLALALRWSFLKSHLKSKLHLMALGVCIALICTTLVGTYIVLHEQKHLDTIYQGKLEPFKPKKSFWGIFIEKE